MDRTPNITIDDEKALSRLTMGNFFVTNTGKVYVGSPTGNLLLNQTVSLQTPQRTFFVSPGFTDSSPYYSTVQAAINATDGTNVYAIIVYPGTYTEQIFPKNGNILIGTDRDKCKITTTANNVITCSLATAPNDYYGFYNIGITATGTSASAMEITTNSGAFTFRMNNCLLTAANSNAFHFVNSTSGDHDILLEESYLNGTGGGTLGPLQWQCNSKGIKFKIRRCWIVGQEYVYQCVGLVYEYCVFEGGALKVPASGFDKTYRQCTFLGGTTSSAASDDATMGFENCTFNNHIFSIAGGAAQWGFDLCKFAGTTSDTNYFDINSSTGSLRLRNCSIDNGKINFSAKVDNFLSCIDVVVRNSGGNFAIAHSVAGSAATVMLGNFTSNKPLHGSAIQNASSFNVNLSKPI